MFVLFCDKLLHLFKEKNLVHALIIVTVYRSLLLMKMTHLVLDASRQGGSNSISPHISILVAPKGPVVNVLLYNCIYLLSYYIIASVLYYYRF